MHRIIPKMLTAPWNLPFYAYKGPVCLNWSLDVWCTNSIVTKMFRVTVFGGVPNAWPRLFVQCWVILLLAIYLLVRSFPINRRIHHLIIRNESGVVSIYSLGILQLLLARTTLSVFCFVEHWPHIWRFIQRLSRGLRDSHALSHVTQILSNENCALQS